MRLSNLLVGATLAGAILTACTTDEITIPKSELYAREFIKKFGVIDPDRDFNAATHSGVTVVTTRPTDVKIYADINGKRYIFAEGRKISGTTPITFDVPASVKEVLVDMDGRLIKTPLGGTVRANSTGRAIWEKKDAVVEISRVDYRNISDEAVRSFENYLPEEKNNLGKVTQNFSFIANGDFTIYPIFWNTRSYNTLGIYYIDEEANEMVYVPFYTNKITPVDGTKGNLLYTTADPDAPDLFPAQPNVVLKDENKPLIIPNSELGTELANELKPEDYNNNGRTSFLDFTDVDWKTFKRRWLVQRRGDHHESFLKNYTPYFDLDEMVQAMGGDKWWYEQNKALYLSDILCEAVDATHVKITNIAVGAVNKWIYPGTTDQASRPSWLNDDVKGWKSRGIHVNIEPGTKFGMYLRVWYEGNGTSMDAPEKKPNIDNVDIVRVPLDADGMPQNDGYRRFYSEAKYNEVKGGSNVFGATYMYDAPSGISYRALGFEDYGETHDLNDMMFFISSAKPQEIPDVDDKDNPDPEVYQWLIAAEDLAGTYDWDFNDAVFAVSATTIVDGEDNKTTKTEITVEPLAAGGTLPIYVMFNGDISVENSEGTLENRGLGHHNIGPELHRWLGGYYRSPINVKEDVATAAGEPLKFTVAGEWSLTDKYQNKPQWEQQDVKGMGGFYVLVNPGNTLNHMQMTISKFEEANLDDEKHFHKVTPPSSFDKQDQVVVSPEMLCLETHWCWPKEEQGIHEVYYYFQPWLTGEATEWYSDPANHWDAARVVTRK